MHLSSPMLHATSLVPHGWSYLLDRSSLFSPHETIMVLQMRTFRGHMSLEVLRPPTNGPAPGTDEANHVTASLGKWLVAAALVLLRLNVVVGVRGLRVLPVSRHHSRSLGRVSATGHGSELWNIFHQSSNLELFCNCQEPLDVVGWNSCFSVIHEVHYT